MGLLDFKMPAMDTPEGQGLLAAAFSLMSAQKYPGQKGALAGALGDAGRQYMGTVDNSRNQLQRRAYLDQQMKAQQLQLEEAQRQRAEQEQELAAIREQFGPNGTFDPRALLQRGGYGAFEKGLKINSALNPAPAAPIKLGENDRLLDPSTFRELVSPVQKPQSLPSGVQEYEYAKAQGYAGTYTDWLRDNKRAGASSVNVGMPKIDIKMGDSVAGQVGPMLKDSRTAVHGAVKMFDAASRIEQALASNQVSAGPLTSQVQTVKQFVQKIAGGNDENIRQTQQVIRSLAQMAVEARKQLQGQGQVTENEAKAVAKADAGDIDSLTTGELADLVTLTKRAAHFTAKGHQEMLGTMEANEGTRGAVPFYRVPGMDALLKHEPKLPQIGGGGDVRSRADAILRGK